MSRFIAKEKQFDDFDLLKTSLETVGDEDVFPLYEQGFKGVPAKILCWIQLNPINGFVQPIAPWRFDRLTNSPRATASAPSVTNTVALTAGHTLQNGDVVTLKDVSAAPQIYHTYGRTLSSVGPTSATYSGVAVSMDTSDELIKQADFSANAIGPQIVADTGGVVNIFIDGGIVVNGNWCRLTMYSDQYEDVLERGIFWEWQGRIYSKASTNGAWLITGYAHFFQQNIACAGLGRFGGSWSRVFGVADKTAPAFGTGSAVGTPGDGDIVTKCWGEVLHEGIRSPSPETYERTSQIMGPNITPDDSFKFPGVTGANVMRTKVGMGMIGTFQGGGGGAPDDQTLLITYLDISMGDEA